MRLRDAKRRLSDILTAAEPDDALTRAVNVGLMLLIATNGIALVVGTVAHIHATSPIAFALFEQISIYVFSLEYALRLWSCTSIEGYRRPIRGRLRFIFTPMALVDLLAVGPFYLPMLGVDMRSLRLLRLFRVFRLVKLARYSKTLKLFERVVRSRSEELMTVLVFLAILLVMSSTLLFYVEHEEQPAAFSSIPATMWWAVATLTTVGYGDMAPMTALGRLFGAFIAILGIGLFALPAGILGSAFIEEVQNKKAGGECPHCGELWSGKSTTEPRSE